MLLIFWLVVTLTASNQILEHYGGPYLLLDPEYMGEVSYISFMIVGFALGGFIMTWNTCFYMLNSYRFRFLATLEKPFAAFCLNNFLIPLSFSITYVVTLVRFQKNQGLSNPDIIENVVAMLFGQILMVVAIILYFAIFNKNVHKFLSGLTEKTRKQLEKRNVHFGKLDFDVTDATQWPVETYISGALKVRLVRQTDHYDKEILRRVLQQHDYNSVVIIIISLSLLFAFSYLLDNPLFRIPAGASFLLVLCVTMAIVTLITYFFRGWRLLAFVLIIAGINYASQYDILVYKNKVLGIDYDEPYLKYNTRTVAEHVGREQINNDKQELIGILNRWKRNTSRNYKNTKPVMVIVQSAGGGLKSCYFTTHVLQQLEIQTSGKLMDHTVLMTGASGGMLGAAYFRELLLRHKTQGDVDYLDPAYVEDAGKDLLNSMATAIASNDLFFPWQRYQYNGKTYSKDRGYWFDKQFNENTSYILNKSVMDYAVPERKALIPMMVLSPTIVNDQRLLIISPQPMSFLTRPFIYRERGRLEYLSPDAVDFMRFFERRGAADLPFSVALRMNATYPYIFPSVNLPTLPEMKIMDAGIRDNYGFVISTRFVNVFRQWIETNTSGVIFLQIRTDNKLKKHEKNAVRSSFINELTSPFGNIYSNFLYEQEYVNDHLVGLLANSMKVPVSVLDFSYVPAVEDREASMSLHLTRREKYDIKQAFWSENNQRNLTELKRLMGIK